MCKAAYHSEKEGKKKESLDYAVRRQFNEKPSTILGCPEPITDHTFLTKEGVGVHLFVSRAWGQHAAADCQYAVYWSALLAALLRSSAGAGP